jgi:hypothetical protein
LTVPADNDEPALFGDKDFVMGRRTGLKANRQPRRDRRTAPALVPPAAEVADAPDDILSAMAAAVASESPGSTADALRTLRLAYPHHPLALRLAALAVAMKRAEPGTGVLFAPPGQPS